MLSETAKSYLIKYIELFDPKFWLFEGQTGGQYSESSIQSIFNRAKIKAKINEYTTVHGLRHSFATHLIEDNVPLHVVKDLLGHNSIKTTEVYLHISNKVKAAIQSPLDGLNL